MQHSIHIKIKGNPPTRTAQQKGLKVINGHPMFFEKKVVRDAKTELMWKLKPYVPAEPMTGPLYIEIRWAFELKSCKKPYWKTTRPDLDNLEKGLLDILGSMGFFHDDAQIVMKQTGKVAVPSGEGSLEIFIREVTKEDD
jgi:Holliday junction resolvase RusA-like endonuclease